MHNGLAPTIAGDVLHAEEVGGPLEPLILPRDGAAVSLNFEIRLPYGLPGTSEFGTQR